MDQLRPQNLSQKAPLLQQKYQAFYRDYMERMLSVGSVADTSYYKNLRIVLNNKDYKDLKQAVTEKFPTLEQREAELIDAFKHVRYYYPEQKIPRLISFFSGFAVQTPVGNNYIGIGLDMFLGADSKFYPALRKSIPYYIARRFTPENITPRVMEAFIREDMFPEKDAYRSRFSKIIYNGKIMYLMDAFMPDMPDSLKIGYTAEQMKWCENYEAGIWGYFLGHNLLYETDYMKIQKYLTEAPFTPGIGQMNNSSPKLAVFIGWQIVKKYMDEHPELSVPQLMADDDYQKLLNRSGYRPK
jgi:hypothetical protein